MTAATSASVVLDIRLKKVSKIYHEGENVTGVVVVHSKNEMKHDGVTLTLDGSVTLQLSSKSTGVFEAFYNSVKPIQLVYYSLEVCKPGRLPPGKTEIPFEFPLRPKGSKTLHETYHGVFVNIQYLLKCDVKRSLLNKDMQKIAEFIVEYAEGEKAICKQVNFHITPDSLQNVREVSNHSAINVACDPTKSKIPRFAVRGKLDSTSCNIARPFTGEIVVEHCEAAVKSIELQLVRVETCGCAEGYARDATEIQNIQIGEGDVVHEIPIPIYMVFPRLFTCPTLVTSNFKVAGKTVNVRLVKLRSPHINIANSFAPASFSPQQLLSCSSDLHNLDFKRILSQCPAGAQEKMSSERIKKRKAGATDRIDTDDDVIYSALK